MGQILDRFRYWLYDLKHVPYKIKSGFKNLFRWAPIIWRDRDFDYSYLLGIMKFKLQNMISCFDSHVENPAASVDIRYMKICISLIEKIESDFYDFEPCDYLEIHPSATKNDKTPTDFFKKYPGSYRKAMSDPRFSNYSKSDEGIAIAMGMVRNEKARRILFSILNQKIQHWWF